MPEYLTNASTVWGILISLLWRVIVIQLHKHVSACSNIVLPTPPLIESHFLCLCRSLAHPFWQTTWVFRCLWIIWKSWQSPALPKSCCLSIFFLSNTQPAESHWHCPQFPPFISWIYWAYIFESFVKKKVILHWLIMTKMVNTTCWVHIGKRYLLLFWTEWTYLALWVK